MGVGRFGKLQREWNAPSNEKHWFCELLQVFNWCIFEASFGVLADEEILSDQPQEIRELATKGISCSTCLSS